MRRLPQQGSPREGQSPARADQGLCLWQVRFELGYYALKPDIRVIAPWREWSMTSRSSMIEYAEKNGIPVEAKKRNAPPYSMDANLLHTSYEGNALEDPWVAAPEDMFRRSVSPEQAPDKATEVEIEFEGGDAVAIDGVRLSPAALLTKLNALGGANGVGRLDLVESRFVGMKSRGVYETPGGTIYQASRPLTALLLQLLQPPQLENGLAGAVWPRVHTAEPLELHGSWKRCPAAPCAGGAPRCGERSVGPR